MTNFLNSNGLIDGKIPPGKECPFWKECSANNANCPIGENIRKEKYFSCAFARAASLSKEGKND